MLSRVQLGIMWIRINSLFDSFSYPQVPMDFQSIGPRLLQQQKHRSNLKCSKCIWNKERELANHTHLNVIPSHSPSFLYQWLWCDCIKINIPIRLSMDFFFSLGLDLEVHKKLEQKTRWPFSQNLPVTLYSCQVPRYNNHCTAFFENLKSSPSSWKFYFVKIGFVFAMLTSIYNFFC